MQFINIMSNWNIKNLYGAELLNAFNYCQRPIDALLHVPELLNTPLLGILLNRQYYTIKDNLGLLSPLTSSNSEEENTSHDHIDLPQMKEMLHDTHGIFQGMIRTFPEREDLQKLCVKHINILYSLAFELQVFCTKSGGIEVQITRPMLATSLKHEVINEQEIHQFYIHFDELAPACDNNVSITCLDQRRTKKYDDLIKEAHEYIYRKMPKMALQAFEKAKSMKETAEVLTLIGLAYSLLGQKEKAKSYCLEAIKKDPDYGPPYNDLGTYLLSEGKITEALKWFELAKKSLNYQNREYPFINSGRAYMLKQELQKALGEFNHAFEMAPYHKELESTITKIEKSLSKIKEKKDSSLLPNRPLGETPPDTPPEHLT
jgi:Tfp pilus assembly protein PilF